MEIKQTKTLHQDKQGAGQTSQNEIIEGYFGEAVAEAWLAAALAVGKASSSLRSASFS